MIESQASLRMLSGLEFFPARMSNSADGELSLLLIYTCVCVLGMRKETEGRTVSWMWWPI